MGNRIGKREDVQRVYDKLGKPGVKVKVSRSWGHRIITIDGQPCRLDKLIKKLETEIRKSRQDANPTTFSTRRESFIIKAKEILLILDPNEHPKSKGHNPFSLIFGSKKMKLNNIIAKLSQEDTKKTGKNDAATELQSDAKDIRGKSQIMPPPPQKEDTEKTDKDDAQTKLQSDVKDLSVESKVTSPPRKEDTEKTSKKEAKIKLQSHKKFMELKTGGKGPLQKIMGPGATWKIRNTLKDGEGTLRLNGPERVEQVILITHSAFYDVKSSVDRGIEVTDSEGQVTEYLTLEDMFKKMGLEKKD